MVRRESLDRDLSGQVLADRYELIECIGEGGMGSVYRAQHRKLKKIVAVKVLHRAMQFGRPEVSKRFLREARLAASLQHDNVVDITDFGETEEGLVFMTMEYLDGQNLETVLEREGRLPWLRVKALMLQILDALGAAHAQGIIHRDMKPANCFVVRRRGRSDHVMVLDFGIAKLIEQDPHATPHTATATGLVMGTAAYMSPEQAHATGVDHRTDLYSLGVILFELLTGERPFSARTPMAVLVKHIHNQPRSPREVAPDANIPVEIEQIILKLLAKQPDDRYRDAAEVSQALRGAIPAQRRVALTPTPQPPPQPKSSSSSSAAAYVLLGGLVLVAGYQWWNLTRNREARDSDGIQAVEPAAAEPKVRPVAAQPDEPWPPVDLEQTEDPPDDAAVVPASAADDPPRALAETPAEKTPTEKIESKRRDRSSRGRPRPNAEPRELPSSKPASGSGGDSACLRECANDPGLSATDRATCRLACRNRSKPTVETWKGETQSKACVEPCACSARCKSARQRCASECSGEDECQDGCDDTQRSCTRDCDVGSCSCR